MKTSQILVYHAAYTLKKIRSACIDLAPIVAVIAFFQFVIIRKPLPDFGEILLGTGLVVIGLSMFIEGLERALFPLGEGMAHALSRKGSLFWLLIFSFALGFSTTVAEPALIAVTNEAADIAIQGGLIENDVKTRNSYSLGLRLTVAFSVGFSILLGVLRILRNWPLHYLIIGGYGLVMLMTLFAPQVPIVANADMEDSVDILRLAGCSHVFQFMNMLGHSLARCTLGARTRSNIIGRFENLVIAETPAMRTQLVGKSIREIGLRQATGINIVGLWNRGLFTLPRPETTIEPSTVLVLAGSEEQLAVYGAYVGEVDTVDSAPALILGGGRVGKAAVSTLKEQGVAYRIVEKNARISEDGDNCIVGSAADHQTLIKAGIDTAPSVFITNHNDDVNIYLTIYCRRLRPDIQIISRATLDRNINVLHAAGADLVMSHASMAANTIINILTPDRVLMLTEGLNIFRCKVHQQLVGKNLLTSGIRESTGCSVIAIFRNDSLRINPDPTELLGVEDELLMIGTAVSEKAFVVKYPDKKLKDLVQTGDEWTKDTGI